MPAYYQYNCDNCDYSARRYRNVRRCKCGGNLIRIETPIERDRRMIECAEYKLTTEVCADKITDLKWLLRMVAGEVLDGAVAGSGGGSVGSYTFNLENRLEAIKKE